MDAIQDQSSSGPGNASRSKLRYPLRSASKPKDDKPATADTPIASVPNRGRPASNVSKSVSVLDLSGKDKSAKPPRRLSIPAKSTVSPLGRPAVTITPISENRVKRSANGQGKGETPSSDASRSMNRRKFSVLSSASYWLSQIKLSESAAKHAISLGFFKLALEAGCEPLQRMRDELKIYVRQHDLGELGESVKELVRSYNISEDLEQIQVSETCSQVPEGTRSSNEDTHSSASSIGAKKLKPKCLNLGNVQAAKVAESAKESNQTRLPASKNRESLNQNSSNIQKKSQKPSVQAPNKEKEKIKNQGKKAASGKDPADSPAEETLQEDKENMDAQLKEEISSTEVL